MRNITDGGAAGSSAQSGGGSYLGGGGGGGGTTPPILGANGGGGVGGMGGHPPVRYKLAEHRYGREEMLSLYEPTNEVPEDLRDMSIFVLRAQSPVLLQPQTEEEQVCRDGLDRCFIIYFYFDGFIFNKPRLKIIS